MSNGNDAEEALSVAMMKLIGCWNENESRLRCPMAWATIVVRNVCTDMLRQNAKRMVCLAPENDGVSSFADRNPNADARLPFEEMESREICGLLLECLRNLPESIESTALLRFRDGLDYRDIAICLKIREATARKRVEYARRLLKREAVVRMSATL